MRIVLGSDGEEEQKEAQNQWKIKSYYKLIFATYN